MLGAVSSSCDESAPRSVRPVVYLMAFLAYAIVRIIYFPAFHQVRTFPDTPVYINLASHSLLSSYFWTGPRPWTTPLLYKLVGNAPQSIAIFQLFLSIACWGLLALSVAATLRSSWLKLIGFAGILLFSLSSEIIMWDGVILSDSISLSLMALWIACWLWLARTWHFLNVALLIGVALFWSFARDTNAWIILVVASALLIGTAAGLLRTRFILVAGALAIIFAANDYSANRGRRWVVAFINNVGLRILPVPERTEFFKQLGMPVTWVLMDRAGKKAWHDDWAFLKNPKLGEFRRWLYESGKLSYVRFLLSHPALTLQEPLRHPEQILASELRNYAPVNFSPILRGPLAEIVYFKNWALLSIWLAGIIVGWIVGSGIWRGSGAMVVALGMIVLTYPHAILVWHGDPNEIDRHALQASVQLRLGIWLILLTAADTYMARARMRQSSATAGDFDTRLLSDELSA